MATITTLEYLDDAALVWKPIDNAPALDWHTPEALQWLWDSGYNYVRLNVSTDRVYRYWLRDASQANEALEDDVRFPPKYPKEHANVD